jgi:hypothetical protein
MHSPQPQEAPVPATAAPLPATVRAADRFGKGIRGAPRDALVADLVDPAMRGRAFGHIRAMDHAGAAVGPLAACGMLVLTVGDRRPADRP